MHYYKEEYLYRLALSLITLILLLAVMNTISAEDNTTDTNFPINYNGHSYCVFDKSQTWTEAKNYCESIGGHLVTIANAEENNLLVSIAKTKNFYWIGMKLFENDEYRWITGEEVTYQNFLAGQPDNYLGNQGYCMILTKDWDYGWYSGLWGDIEEDANSWDNVPFWGFANVGFICEWDTILDTNIPIPDPSETPTTTIPPTPTPTTEPTEEPTPLPTIGDTFVTNELKYKITGNHTVSFLGLEKAMSKTTVTIPATVSIGQTSYKVTEIAAKALYKDTKVKTLTISQSIKTIGKNAFASCMKLATVSGGAAVVTIDDSAFSGCKALKTFPVMSKLQSIETSAFKGCVKLAKFTLAAKVKSIGKNAFNGCKGLKNIDVKTTKLTDKNVGAAAFKGIYKTATFKCPAKKLKAYKKLFIKKGAPKTCIFE